jgi:hypothetical protein
VHATLTARYTFGRPVAGAQVRLRALEQIQALEPFHTARGVTDARGQLQFEVPLERHHVGQPIKQGDAVALIEARVTGPSGTEFFEERVQRYRKEARQRYHQIAAGGVIALAVFALGLLLPLVLYAGWRIGARRQIAGKAEELAQLRRAVRWLGVWWLLGLVLPVAGLAAAEARRVGATRASGSLSRWAAGRCSCRSRCRFAG